MKKKYLKPNGLYMHECLCCSYIFNSMFPENTCPKCEEATEAMEVDK